MPVLKHAKKKLRQDKKRTADNLKIKETFKKLVKKAKANPTKEMLSEAYSSIDKAAKKHIIHKNKAARLKASLAKSVDVTPTVKSKTPTKTASKKPGVKKAEKKTSSKK